MLYPKPDRMFFTKSVIVLSLFLFSIPPGHAQHKTYPWLSRTAPTENISQRFQPPSGYVRLAPPPGSFADWLQHLPLKPGQPSVYLYNGQPKTNQTTQIAVVDLDVGTANLQQCADAVIRLRAEYLFSLPAIHAIHFNFTSGHRADLWRWFQGFRPQISGQNVTWRQSTPVDSSYRNFREYLTVVFRYAGTHSLSQELVRVSVVDSLQIGDVFIQGGFPGHAVLVLDLAQNSKTDHKLFLLGQSYMPAQEFHVLKNPRDARLNPWYPIDFGPLLVTPEWTFKKTDLKRFKPVADR